ncbi:permease [bacterium (Candidatus Gribaldobacteria) CG10_big_fil_rev_8_21_14_0_10_37_21]|uniref:Permease n=1 Tax=bacterium (Candidatus Gribaldobacteria) CG10_big_fil_rev_8_21_14_0_10_37_21 TaxID=2014275 RepID=A0A2H0UTQ4_9BACT|nr:MAG: permease [bacterium (Candidatus Gribaldobacteria) CG10_big_fil_rev_8_21_14_0_10_37_21]
MNIFYHIKNFADWITFDVFGIEQTTHLGDSVNFFIYDSIKIIILLLIINYFMAIVRHYLPVEKLRDFLASRKWYGLDYFFASVFGTITPFCSCSSIPLFIGFIEAGIPLGVTLSFLITSPLVNQVAVVLFAGLFGWKIMILYVISAMLLGIFGGFILGKLKLEKYVADYVWQIKSQKLEIKNNKEKFSALIKKFWHEGFDLTKKITSYVLLGIAVGATIHGYVPAGFFENYIKADNFFAVPIATIVAVPMYANAVGVIPIMQSLVEKGIPLGTAMAFMMAVVGLSLPEALILKRVMKIKLLAYFFGITTINIIILGYLFNAFVK